MWPSKQRAEYKIKCLKDGRIFNNIQEVCEAYGFTKDQVNYRLDDGLEHKDGYSYERVWDWSENNAEAIESTKAVDSKKYVAKYGDKTVPLPGYEDYYTISTSGVITDIQNHGKILKIKSKVTVKNTVILHKRGTQWSQVHNVENLLSKAFGDPETGSEADDDKRTNSNDEKAES